MAKKYFYEYRVVDGDRWDTVAHKMYGDASLVPLLVADNPHMATKELLDIGDVVFIRQDAVTQDLLNTENLPPWK